MMNKEKAAWIAFDLLEEEEVGDRLDRVLADRFEDLSRSKIAQAIKRGAVLVNGESVKPSSPVAYGDHVDLDRVFFVKEEIKPEAMDLDLVYEDEDLLVVNKKAGLIVHPSDRVRSGTLVNGLLYLQEKEVLTLSNVNGEERPGIVHRLDAQTSGLIIVAKNNPAHRILAQAFQDREVKKTYLALVEGDWPVEDFRVDLPIGRNPANPKKMAVVEGGKEAISTFSCLAHQPKASLLKVEIKTGRTHQIRVHLAHCHHPVVGDGVYGFRKQKIRTSHQMLHAWKVAFSHPRTGQWVSFEADPDPEFQQVLDKLGFPEAWKGSQCLNE